MASKEGTEVLGCCRQAQERLQKGDTVITICLSCAAITEEVSPQVREVSLWEYLLQSDFPWPDHQGEEMMIQDCWRARKRPELQQAVRECMKRMNIKPIEMEDNFAYAEFDGVWRYNPVAPGNLSIAPKYFGEVRDHGVHLLPKEEQEQRMVEWCRQYTTDRVAAYCNACLKGIRMGGANGVHLAELITQNI